MAEYHDTAAYIGNRASRSKTKTTCHCQDNYQRHSEHASVLTSYSKANEKKKKIMLSHVLNRVWHDYHDPISISMSCCRGRCSPMYHYNESLWWLNDMEPNIGTFHLIATNYHLRTSIIVQDAKQPREAAHRFGWPSDHPLHCEWESYFFFFFFHSFFLFSFRETHHLVPLQWTLIRVMLIIIQNRHYFHAFNYFVRPFS